jgi:hypothetical protein
MEEKNQQKKKQPSETNCAFCDTYGEVTEEHVMPEWLRREIVGKNELSVFNPKQKRFTSIAAYIRDVCRKCNSGPLSGLDTYGRKVYDNYLSHVVFKGSEINFSYDFELLSRFLLKIIYNYDRFLKKIGELSETEDHRVKNVRYRNKQFLLEPAQYKEYILGRSTVPEDFLLALYLTAPMKLTDEIRLKNKERFNLDPGEHFEPELYATSAFVLEDTERQNTYYGNRFRIKSYNFLVIPLSSDPEIRNPSKKYLPEVLKYSFDNVEILNLSSKNVRLKPSNHDFLDADYSDEQYSAIEKFLDRQEQKSRKGLDSSKAIK